MALIKRAMVVDCDVHHGNGTAAVFTGDQSVFTLSIHQFNNYPSEKPLSSLDIHLADGVGDAEYLHRLGNGYRAALAMFKPELVIYVAGADPYYEDQLGGLSLTFEGLKERDRLVIRTAMTHKIPVAVVLAGGYAQNVEDTITVHANTAQVGKEVLRRSRNCETIRPMKFHRLGLAVLGLSACSAFGQTPRPLQLADILTWKRIQAQTVSSDGQWFAYRLAPAEGNAEVVVRNLKTGSETRYPAGDRVASSPTPAPGGGGGRGAAAAGAPERSRFLRRWQVGCLFGLALDPRSQAAQDNAAPHPNQGGSGGAGDGQEDGVRQNAPLCVFGREVDRNCPASIWGGAGGRRCGRR